MTIFQFILKIFKKAVEKVIQITLISNLNHALSTSLIILTKYIFKYTKYILICIYNSLLQFKSFVLKLYEKIILMNQLFLMFFKAILIYALKFIGQGIILVPAGLGHMIIVLYNYSLKFIIIEPAKFTLSVISQALKTVLTWLLILTILVVVFYYINTYSPEQIKMFIDPILSAKDYLLQVKDQMLSVFQKMGEAIDRNTSTFEEVAHRFETGANKNKKFSLYFYFKLVIIMLIISAIVIAYLYYINLLPLYIQRIKALFQGIQGIGAFIKKAFDYFLRLFREVPPDPDAPAPAGDGGNDNPPDAPAPTMTHVVRLGAYMCRETTDSTYKILTKAGFLKFRFCRI